MATLEDVRDLCLALPGVIESAEGFAFSVPVKGKLKGFVWAWNERVAPQKPRVPNLGVMAIIVPNLTAKDLLLDSNPEKYFTEPHYNGFPAILVRLEAVSREDLEDLLTEAWRCKAPPDIQRQSRDCR